MLESIKKESKIMIKEKDIKLDFLNKEIKKNVNTQYIKNILIQFFNGDQSVNLF